MPANRIRVISICTFQREGRILVFEGYDSKKGVQFYRPLGGEIEPGETSCEALVQEIREEIGFEVCRLKLLGVLENVFSWEGQPRHEIVFVFDGQFVDLTVYQIPEFRYLDCGNMQMRAVWRKLSSFGESERLYPEGLANLIRDQS